MLDYKLFVDVETEMEAMAYSKLFPLAQRRVKLIADYLKSFKSVEHIIVFGSAITSNYGQDSDIDLCVISSEGEDFLFGKKLPKRNFEVDIIAYRSLDELNNKDCGVALAIQRGVIVCGR